MLHGEGINKLN